jgi:MoxR-like ATPase
MNEDFDQYKAVFEGDEYIPSEEVRAAVNTAIAVEQPLVVTGEPGTGKTRLAYSIAKRLGYGDVYEFITRSDHQAKDCLYRFEALRRLYDVQAQKADAQDARRYVTDMALGKAIRFGEPCVVLIDEIDKAPVDFPNDLLGILEDKLRFPIPETNEWVEYKAGKKRPFILITSNEERQLPDAFLRRCVYHHIEFPKTDELRRIVEVNLRKRGVDPSGLGPFLDVLIRRFEEIRKLPDLIKKPATSELIAWARVLVRVGLVDPEKLEKEDLARLYPGAIFKVKADWERATKTGKSGGRSA